ncbi:MAG: COG4280 domain-containing protein [Dehalococcoidales bacterium]
MFSGSTIVLIITVMAASAVEAVEALTIILASGITHGWRSTWEGAIVAFLALAGVVAVLGTTIIHHVDIDVLRVIVGTLLLIFGMQWLTKAILRSSGFKALHDEARIYEKEVEELKKEKHIRTGKRDSVAFVVSFKGVFLEGMEVVMIVITFGLSNGNDYSQLKWAALGAVIAIAVIAVISAIVAKPLAKVPENTLKLGVGIILVSFGMFWMGEGAGVKWPLSDLFILILAAIITATTFGLIGFFKRVHDRMHHEAHTI